MYCALCSCHTYFKCAGTVLWLSGWHPWAWERMGLLTMGIKEPRTPALDVDKPIRALALRTGAVARRLDFPGSGEVNGFWNKGISACAVCDGAAPLFRRKPLAVIGGGDTAMEEAGFLTKYGSKVYIIHRRDELRASKIMQKRTLENPKIEARPREGTKTLCMHLSCSS